VGHSPTGTSFSGFPLGPVGAMFGHVPAHPPQQRTSNRVRRTSAFRTCASRGTAHILIPDADEQLTWVRVRLHGLQSSPRRTGPRCCDSEHSNSDRMRRSAHIRIVRPPSTKVGGFQRPHAGAVCCALRSSPGVNKFRSVAKPPRRLGLRSSWPNLICAVN